MKFKYVDKEVCLKEDPTLSQTIVSLKSMVKTVKGEKSNMWCN